METLNLILNLLEGLAGWVIALLGSGAFLILFFLGRWIFKTSIREGKEWAVLWGQAPKAIPVVIICIIAIGTFILLSPIVLPRLGRLFIQVISYGITENNRLPDPPSLGNENTPVPLLELFSVSTPTPTPFQYLTTPTTSTPTCYVVLMGGATVRPSPDSTSGGPEGLGLIPAGTVVKIGNVVPSNCVDGICSRGQLAEAIAGFLAGGWIHLAAVGPPVPCPP